MEKNGSDGIDRKAVRRNLPDNGGEKYRKLKLIQIEANADYKVNQALHDSSGKRCKPRGTQIERAPKRDGTPPGGDRMMSSSHD